MASIKTLISSSIFLNLYLHIHFGSTLITKSKFCVEYRVQGGRWNQRILGSVINTTERHCLMQCTRNKRCKAYNICQGTGTCELLPRVGKCDEIRKHQDCNFVSLKGCTKYVPWITERSDMAARFPCLGWRHFDFIWECPVTYMRAPDGDFCVALLSHKGLYLPGWYGPNLFRVITLDEHGTWCRSGYLLQKASTCSVVWGGVYCWKTRTRTSSRGWNMEGRHPSLHRGWLYGIRMACGLLQPICTKIVYFFP